MSLSTELLDHISANTSLTLATDLFLGFLPREVDTGVFIREVGGTENDTNMYQQLFSLTSVGIDPVTAESKCREVYELMSFNNGLQLATIYIFNSVPMATPQFLHLAKDNYPVYVASFLLYSER